MAFKYRRWTLANLLPVMVAVGMIMTLWGLHWALCLYPALFPDCEQALCDYALVRAAIVETVVSQIFTFMIVVCFIRAVVTDPGSIPRQAPWIINASSANGSVYQQQDQSNASPLLSDQVEVKQTGGRRRCKWCVVFKPDRCHHCRVCRSCILRMDHHCPWIANCVGFKNHKYFFLLVLYSAINSLLVAVSTWYHLLKILHIETTALMRFLAVFALTLSSIMTILLSGFFLFHLWLVLHGTTTIEFCEKTVKMAGHDKEKPSRWIYDLGAFANLQCALGPYMVLWLLPVCPPGGNGLTHQTCFDLKLVGTEAIQESSNRSCEPSETNEEEEAPNPDNLGEANVEPEPEEEIGAADSLSDVKDQ